MKNKLKILFEYLKNFKHKRLTMSVDVDRTYIEEMSTIRTEDHKQVPTPDFFYKILEDLIEMVLNEFTYHINLDYDDYWTLHIIFMPFEEKIFFSAEVKNLEYKKREIVEKVNFLNESTREIITDIQTYYDVSIIDFKFEGKWDDGSINYVELGGRHTLVSDDDEEKYWIIINDLMSKIYGKFWNERYGLHGEIRIWDEDIFCNVTETFDDYVDSGFNLTVTMDNVDYLYKN